MAPDNQQKPEQIKKRVKTNEKGEPIKLVYHYYMNILCFQFRVISLEYFLDTCTEWELTDYIELLPYIDRTEWETARLCAYIDAKSHFKNINKYSDICEFKWEQKEQEEEHKTEISNDEIKRLKELAKQWEKD